MLYGIYAWGIPVVLTGIAIGMQFGKPPGFVTPGFGSRRCWFVGKHLAFLLSFKIYLTLFPKKLLLYSGVKKAVVAPTDRRENLKMLCCCVF